MKLQRIGTTRTSTSSILFLLGIAGFLLQYHSRSCQGFVVRPNVWLSTIEHSHDTLFQCRATRTPENFLVEYFTYLEEALASSALKSFTLTSSKKKTKERGEILQIHGRPVQTKEKDMRIQLTLKYHLATDIVKNYQYSEVVPLLRSITLVNSTQTDTEFISEWGPGNDDKNGGRTAANMDISVLRLDTTTASYECPVKDRQPRWKIVSRAVSQAPQEALSHDRVKERPLDLSNAEFLQTLGVINANGKPRMASKLRQCQKFVEVVHKLIPIQDQPVRIVDMGCGRGYLTWSLHHYLLQHNYNVTSLGIDIRPKLIRELNQHVASFGTRYSSLSFQEGSIEDSFQSPQLMDVLIALHACDTATDDALWAAISGQANIIVVAPCCHKEIRQQLNHHLQRTASEHPYMDVLSHNIYRERIAETVTDSLRALLLEYAGYQTNVFEFVGGEHTSKNVMITAVKRKRNAPNKNELLSRIQSLAKLHGVFQQRLADFMKVDLGTTRPKQLSSKRMPPL